VEKIKVIADGSQMIEVNENFISVVVRGNIEPCIIEKPMGVSSVIGIQGPKGDKGDPGIDVSQYGGYIDVVVDSAEGVDARASMRIAPGSVGGSNQGSMQVLEDGSVHFYDATGVEFACINSDGTTNLSSSQGGVDVNYFVVKTLVDSYSLDEYVVPTSDAVSVIMTLI